MFKVKSIGYGWKALGRSTWKNHTLREIMGIIRNDSTMDETATSELCQDAENNLKWEHIKKTVITEKQLNDKTLISHYKALQRTHRKKWKKAVKNKLRGLQKAIAAEFGQRNSDSDTVSGHKRRRSLSPIVASNSQQESHSVTVSKPQSKRQRTDGNSNTVDSRRKEESPRESQQQQNEDNSSIPRNADSIFDEEEEVANGQESKVNYGAEIRKFIRTVPLLSQSKDKGSFVCHEYFSWPIAVHMLENWEVVKKCIEATNPEKQYNFNAEKQKIEVLKTIGMYNVLCALSKYVHNQIDHTRSTQQFQQKCRIHVARWARSPLPNRTSVACVDARDTASDQHVRRQSGL